jgi:hypothetical protein
LRIDLFPFTFYRFIVVSKKYLGIEFVIGFATVYFLSYN